ncbi:hypothetical protein [Burkholderia arboris]
MQPPAYLRGRARVRSARRFGDAGAAAHARDDAFAHPLMRAVGVA